MKTTAAQRKKAERLRKKKQGLIRVEAWIKPEDRPVLNAIVEKLNAKV